MKKTWATILGTLVVVLVISLGVNYLVPLFGDNYTYSATNCLTEYVNSSPKEMDIFDIAKLYRDNQATVAVKVKTGSVSSLGSGVCIASNGYTTSLQHNGMSYTANQGSYIVTNYHVIDEAIGKSGAKVTILTEKEETYNCEILWENRNLDMAILYTSEVCLDYVTMKDIIVDPKPGEKFDYQEIFCIGCPLNEEDYLNRLTIGNIGTNDTIVMYTDEKIDGYSVMYNLYEDVVDITAGISPGNSGGGCFDEDGYLIGLNTLGTDESITGGNQMNGIVPIYPAMQVIDKVIYNNEVAATHKIYTLENLGLYGIDAWEASVAASYTTYQGATACYYLNGKYYSKSLYSSRGFNFTSDGYYLINNAYNFGNFGSGAIITSCKNAQGEKFDILDRNDLIYFLLNCNVGDTIQITTNTGTRPIALS